MPRAWRCRPNRGVLGAVGRLDRLDGMLDVVVLMVLWAVQPEAWRFQLQPPRADWGHRDAGVLALPDD